MSTCLLKQFCSLPEFNFYFLINNIRLVMKLEVLKIFLEENKFRFLKEQMQKDLF